MRRSFLKYHRQHLSSPWYHKYPPAKYHYCLTNNVIYIYGRFISSFYPRITQIVLFIRQFFFPSPSKSGVSILEILDVPRSAVSHGTSPSRGVSNLRSDEPQAAAASSRSGTIKSTAVPWVYGKYGCIGEFRAWRNRGRRQSRFRETREARLLR